MEETVAVGVALKTGVEPADDRPRSCRAIDAMPKGFLASMAHDILAGKPIEVDAPVGRRGAARQREPACRRPSHKFITQALAPFANGKPQI